MRLTLLCLAAIALFTTGCFGTPTPLAPGIHGSVGVPHFGVLSSPAEQLKKKGDGYALLRSNGRNWGNPRLVHAIADAAKAVVHERKGAPLMIGDMSDRFGGEASGHRSHRSGRDADLLFYITTPDGRPLPSPGFVRFGADGLAQLETGSKKFVRLDVAREWLLVKALVTSKEANVQWLFCARWLEALIIEYARAKDEDPEVIWQAENVLLQPGDSAAHDDHLHLRIACTPDEAVAGCEGGGPYWPWLPALPQLAPPPDQDLAAMILAPLKP